MRELAMLSDDTEEERLAAFEPPQEGIRVWGLYFKGKNEPSSNLNEISWLPQRSNDAVSWKSIALKSSTTQRDGISVRSSREK